MTAAKRLKKLKPSIHFRHQLKHSLDDYFLNKNFLSVDIPPLTLFPSVEAHIEPVKLKLHDDGHSQTAYLLTSPELCMKPLLAAGNERLVSYGPVFRDEEKRSSKEHLNCFYLWEWYYLNHSYSAIKEDLSFFAKDLFPSLCGKSFKQISLTWDELYRDVLGFSLKDMEDWSELCRRAQSLGFETDSPREAFDWFWADSLEKTLYNEDFVILDEFPAFHRAYARLNPVDNRFALRFEWLYGGREIGNAYDELCDSKEQEKIMEDENQQRKLAGKKPLPLDNDFIESLGMIPTASGIAMGMERLLMALTGASLIEDVQPFGL